jgi:undecaprenyl-diphosphatase
MIPLRTLARAAAVVLLAAAGIRWFAWRRHRRGPVEVRASRHVELPPNETGKGLALLVNADAGSADDAGVDLRSLFPDADVTVLDDPTHLTAALERAREQPGVVALGAAGGDGTLSAAAAVATDAGLPLVAIPGGTLNHLARDLGLESPEDAVVAVQRGDAVEVDLATIDGRTFLNTASFGSYADLVDAREALENQIGKWPAVGVAAVRVLRRGNPLEVEIDGERRPVWMSFIGNCRYQPDGFAPSRRVRLDDGQLDVRVIYADHPWCRTRLVLGLLTGRLGRSPVYRQWVTRSVTVRSVDGPLRLAADGETFDGDEEVTIAKSGHRLAVYTSAT